MDFSKLLTALSHLGSGIEHLAGMTPSGAPSAVGAVAQAKGLIAQLHDEIAPPPASPPAPPPPPTPDPADTSADAMNAGEAAALEQHQA